jgi:galactose mutarotase-like enzyme
MSCVLSEIKIDGLRAILLENEWLRVGVLVDRGSDIFEFTYKPKDLDFLLRLPKGIRNPQTHFSQIRNTKSQFEDYYYGGWQVCLPNSPAFNYRGAELGQHGEVALIPWEVEITEQTPDKLSIKCSVSALRVPISVERTITLEKNSTTLHIEESVHNTSATHLDIMWGQHIAFGLPFLEDGVVIDTNAKTMETEPAMPDHHLFKRGEVYQWPEARSKEGNTIAANRVSAKGAAEYSDLCYLEGYDEKSFYTIKNEAKNVGFGLTWEGNLFKDLWFWQERNATKDFPWWGQCYAVALEPWTSRWTNEPQNAIDSNEWLRLEAGEKRKTKFSASAFEDKFNNKE